MQQEAIGRWPWILSQFGIDERHLVNRHGPCPVCGGKDRFRFDDKEGRGTFYCNGTCGGAGDGYTLLSHYKGCDRLTAYREVKALLSGGRLSAIPEPRIIEPTPFDGVDQKRRQNALRTIWNQAKPVTKGDPVDKYLRARGIVLDRYPREIRYHPTLWYYEKKKKVGAFPAMIAVVRTADGIAATLHRTYLGDGKKADVPEPKKLMAGRHRIVGGAIRLYEATDTLAVAEGIETAFAAHLLSGLPVWAAVTSSIMQSFDPPSYIKKVIVFADNDENNAGIEAAKEVGKRLLKRGIEVKLHLPQNVGEDFLDVWNAIRLRAMAKS